MRAFFKLRREPDRRRPLHHRPVRCWRSWAWAYMLSLTVSQLRRIPPGPWAKAPRARAKRAITFRQKQRIAEDMAKDGWSYGAANRFDRPRQYGR